MIKVSNIANYLKKKYIGKNISIKIPATFNNIKKNSVVFLNKTNEEIRTNIDALILIPKDLNTSGSKCSFIEVDDPRLSFGKIINKFFLIKKIKKGVHKTCSIGNNCKINKSVSIGVNCVIGNNVSLGANTIINNNVVISDNVIVGDNCYIKSGSTIGDDGFGFALVKNKAPVKIPQIGSVIIGSNVEIGANSNIARGSIDNTIIENDVKIDDQVHIAHNCYISKNTVIAAGAIFSGSVKIGKNCWIGLGCTIIQKVDVGENSTIGMGAIVTKNVKKNSTIVGLNSIEIESLARFKNKVKYGK
jgi:UDP-3-O-[3-hydroxymyristoyl] glucosamine N-acyltransferase